MRRVTAALPPALAVALDATAAELRRSRAQVIREILERYLEDYSDVTAASERLQDTSDVALDWNDVRRDLGG